MTTLINQNPVIYETADSNRAWRDDDNDNEDSLDLIDAQEVFGRTDTWRQGTTLGIRALISSTAPNPLTDLVSHSIHTYGRFDPLDFRP